MRRINITDVETQKKDVSWQSGEIICLGRLEVGSCDHGSGGTRIPQARVVLQADDGRSARTRPGLLRYRKTYGRTALCWEIFRSHDEPFKERYQIETVGPTGVKWDEAVRSWEASFSSGAREFAGI